MEENALVSQANLNILDDLSDEYVEKMFLGEAEPLLFPSGISLTQVEQIVDRMVEYKRLRMMYSCALKEIRTKFDVLNTEFSVRYQRNPINFITMRLKSTHSIFEKMHRIKQPVNMQNLEEQLNDIAGLRVICSYVDDIYLLAQALIAQDDIRLIREKDYIANPKPNGYRSLHLIVSVPVFFTDQKKNMKVEVQIRTIAMDFWASLEHEIKYKKDIENQQEIAEQLRKCAEVISETDMTMYDIRRQIEGEEAMRSREKDGSPDMESLLEKLKRLDEPIV